MDFKLTYIWVKDFLQEINFKMTIMTNIVYGRRPSKLFTNCHVSWDTLYMSINFPWFCKMAINGEKHKFTSFPNLWHCLLLFYKTGLCSDWVMIPSQHLSIKQIVINYHHNICPNPQCKDRISNFFHRGLMTRFIISDPSMVWG